MGVLRYKRLLSILCCLVFICSFYGSLTAQAVFGVDDIVIGGALVASAAALTYITVIGLSGSDLAEPLYDAANRANTNINDWLEPKVTAFLEATDGATLLDTQIKSLVGGLSYAKDGVLYFSDALGDFIHDFGEWLIDNGDISVAGSGDVEFPTQAGTITIESLSNGYDCFNQLFINSGLFYVASSAVKSNLDTFFTQYQGYLFVFILPSRAFGSGYNGNVYAIDRRIGQDVVIGSNYGAVRALSLETESMIDNKPAKITAAHLSTGGSATSIFGNGFTQGPSTYYNNINNASSTGASNGLDVWNQDAPAGFAVDPSSVIGGSIGAADVPAGAIAGIGDYVQAIADAIAGIADITLPVAGVGDIPIEPAIPADISIPVTPAIPADIADAVPATGDATQPYPATGDYTLPLADFFPFCIPFDLYRILSAFDASPLAPEFDIPIVVQSIGLNVPVHVDLSEWEPAAVIVRNIGFVVFCAALAWATSKLIQK